MISTAEKIETIAQCRRSGAFGGFVEYAPERFRITADGLTVLVRCGDAGWRVSFKGFEAIDPDLWVAAQLALDCGAGVNVTRHADLGAYLGRWARP